MSFNVMILTYGEMINTEGLQVGCVCVLGREVDAGKVKLDLMQGS